MEAAVKIEGLSKAFGPLTVLNRLTLEVPKGSFCSLLGPSGCGKTTLLNIIGGLDRPTEGRVEIGAQTVFSDADGINVPTERRNIGFVFQSYALWPHMTVLRNVAYALQIRKMPRAEREARAHEMLERLELAHLAQRYPYQLSGGQQQRVAIARSLAYRPQLLLLDEPLSNLDAQLRERARVWLKGIHETFNLTTILVTHDQTEALSLSDTVVLLRQGHIEQAGTPTDIYEHPKTTYAAEFVGSANVVNGVVKRTATADGGLTLVSCGDFDIAATGGRGLVVGAAIGVALRPERIELLETSTDDASGAVVPFEVGSVLYHGSTFEVIGTTPIGSIRVFASHAPQAKSAFIRLPADKAICVAPTPQ